MSHGVLVTGGSRGLGLEIARIHVSRGEAVAILARDAGRLETAAESLGSLPGLITTLACDVRDRDGMAGAVAKFASRAGTIRTLYACAGAIDRGEPGGPFDRSVLETNLLGVVNTVEAWLATGPAKGARAAIVASFSAFRGLPHIPAYGASKAGVAIYAESLRGQLRPRGLNVTTVFLGYLDSELTDRRKSSLLVTPCSKAAAATARAVDRGATSLAFPTRVRALVLLTRCLPDALYDFLVDAKRARAKE